MCVLKVDFLLLIFYNINSGVKVMKELIIVTEYIELKNALKLLDYISTGGEAKYFLQENDCFVNSEKETRRGRKLYDNDILEINKKRYLIKHEN